MVGSVYALEWERLFGLGVALVTLGVAATIMVLGPQLRANRRLGLLMVADAVGLGAGWCIAQMALEASHYRAWASLAWAAYSAQVPLYLLFLATLKTPIVKPFATSVGTGVLWALAAAGALTGLLGPDLFIAGLVPRPGADTFLQVPGPLGNVIPALHALPLPLFALVCALHQWWTSKADPIHRRQATAYVLAFGWRDLSWIFVLGVLPVLTGSSMTDSDPLPTVAYAAGDMVFVLLLAYGVLSAQLFDIDVGARFVIGQSTVAAAAAGVFFLITELAEQLVNAEGLLPGVAAAVVIALAFRPLQTMGRRIAVRALPKRTDDEERTHRVQLYETAVQSFGQDGVLTVREREALDRMRARLGLSPEEVAHMDRSAPRIG